MPIRTYEYVAMAKSMIATRLAKTMMESGDHSGVQQTPYPGEFSREAMYLIENGRVRSEGFKALESAKRRARKEVTMAFACFLDSLTNSNRVNAFLGSI